MLSFFVFFLPVGCNCLSVVVCSVKVLHYPKCALLLFSAVILEILGNVCSFLSFAFSTFHEAACNRLSSVWAFWLFIIIQSGWKHDHHHGFILQWTCKPPSDFTFEATVDEPVGGVWLKLLVNEIINQTIGMTSWESSLGCGGPAAAAARDNTALQHIKQRPVKKQSTPYLTGVNLMAIGCSGLLTLSKRLHVSHSPVLSNWKAARLLPDEVSTVYLKRGWLLGYLQLLIRAADAALMRVQWKWTLTKLSNSGRVFVRHT